MDDLISRQDAIEVVQNRHMMLAKEKVLLINDIEKLPSAEPKRGKWINEGTTGDWQYQIDGRGRSWHEWRCDQCKVIVKKVTFYCPNCGADMRGEKDG